MKHFALILWFCVPQVAAADWLALSGAEIAQALSGQRLVYLDRDDPGQTVDTTQEFRTSGRTLYVYKGRESWGYWRIEGDRYCSQWPPNDLWACFALERRGDVLRFVGEGDDISAAIYAD